MKPYYEDSVSGITIYNGDCREVLASVPLKFSAVVSDPPYGTRVEGDGYGRRQIWKGTQQIENDESFDCAKAGIGACVPLLQKGWVACFVSPKKRHDSEMALREIGLTFRGEVVWDKAVAGLGGGIRYQHESILLLSVGKAEGKSPLFSVIRDNHPRLSGLQLHPHEKPLGILAKLIDYVSDQKGVILDPFMGSGTTLRAAKDMGRGAIGIEVEERYCEIAVNRLRQEVLFAKAGA